MNTFGTKFSKALCDGCARLSSLGSPVSPEWILDIAILESAGTWDPNVLQGKAKLVPAYTQKQMEDNFIKLHGSIPEGIIIGPDMRPEIQGTNGLRLSHGTGATGLFQEMPITIKRPNLPILYILYKSKDPVVQLNDAIERFYTKAIAHKFGPYKSREALYCCNLAPARLIGGTYTDETILYSKNPADKNEIYYYPKAYELNSAPFGLDPKDPFGQLKMKHLAWGLDSARKSSIDRFNAELAAAYVINVGGSG
jgi:hypothetical protein